MPPPAASPPLVGDVGGTHARFALLDEPGGRLHEPRELACADHPSLAAAARAYLAAVGGRPREAAIAVATPIVGDRLQMTNHTWTISVSGTRRELGLDRLVMVNDFAALALALPALPPDTTPLLKDGVPRPRGARAVLGPGTGLGVAGLLPCGEDWLPVTGEGGHRDLAAARPREWVVVQALARRYGHVSAERAVSGPGLIALHEALAEVDGEAAEPLRAAEIGARAAAGACPRCVEAVRLFSAFLGAVAGDVALTFGAAGGVYLGGGVVGKLGAAFDAAAFVARFSAKGRLTAYLEGIPVRRIAHPFPGLVGAAIALRRSDAAYLGRDDRG